MSGTVLSESLLNAIASRLNTRYPLIHNPAEKKLTYGTAGFRTAGAVLPPVAARIVIVAVLRAWQCSAAALGDGHTMGSTIGFMVTASHNPAQDNGFKIIDWDGGMLSPSWEPWCSKIANAATGEDAVEVIKECVAAEKITAPQDGNSSFGLMQLGRDTRASGELILSAVRDVLDTLLRVSYTDHGVVTTPQLHFIVCKANQQPVQQACADVSVELYFEEIIAAFGSLMDIATDGAPGVPRRLVVDTANGVGFLGLQGLLEYAKAHESDDKPNAIARYVAISTVNTHVNSPDILNKECGAEFAHKKQRPSEEMMQWARDHDQHSQDECDNAHYYCLDGDADRVISFSLSSPSADPPRAWRMIDGDRMSILFAMLLHHWLGATAMEKLDVGVVQTAYANGASTAYVRNDLGMAVYMAATGVKNLHPIAQQRDVGVYFEANGHGTVLLKDRVGDKISSDVACAEKARRVLDIMPRLLSQVCGDAIADMLMCEVALRALGLTPAMWADLYADRPSLQTTVTVPNPRVITNNEDETRALTPPGLQEAIDEAVKKTQQAFNLDGSAAARCFVRPSGTEPIVRVYAEASTRQATDALAEEVKKLVVKYCS